MDERQPLERLLPFERFIYEWQYGLAGSFKQSLAETLAKADENNLAKLRKGFPEEVHGFMCFSRQEGWWEEVQAKMQRPKGD